MICKMLRMNHKKTMKGIRSELTRCIGKFTSACGHESLVKEAFSRKFELEDRIEEAIFDAYRHGVERGKAMVPK